MLIRRPFKGLFFYEWQVGPFVFQWRHDEPMGDAPASERAIHELLPKFKVWRDPLWRHA
jgi:hypothetical protein